MNLFCFCFKVIFCSFYVPVGPRVCKFGYYQKRCLGTQPPVVRGSVKIGQEPSAGYPLSELSGGMDRVLHSWQCSIAPWGVIFFL